MYTLASNCLRTFSWSYMKSSKQTFIDFKKFIKNKNVLYSDSFDRASDISRKKKQNFAGFSGANSRKNRPISREKSQNSRKNRPISRNFRWRKVEIRRKIVRFRGILAGKSQISKDFQGQILRKIGRFHGKFRKETSPRNSQ